VNKNHLIEFPDNDVLHLVSVIEPAHFRDPDPTTCLGKGWFNDCLELLGRCLFCRSALAVTVFLLMVVITEFHMRWLIMRFMKLPTR
jgi:hypothetical protein